MNYATQAIVQQGGYTEVVILTIIHGFAPNGEAVTLTATAPAGINVSYYPQSPVQLMPTIPSTNVTLHVDVGASVPVGNASVTIQGTSGANNQSASFKVQVVKYRIVMVHNTFSPPKFNVSVGSTVYWQNLDGPAAGCRGAQVGTGAHSVVFTTLQGANSGSIKQFGIYSYTFTQPGSYFYYSSLDTDHVMNGTVNVLAAGGGIGMTTRMPSFSYFKPSAYPNPPVLKPTTAASPLGKVGEAIPKGLSGLKALGAVYSELSRGAGAAATFGLAALGVALAVSMQSKRMISLAMAVSSSLRSEASRSPPTSGLDTGLFN